MLPNQITDQITDQIADRPHCPNCEDPHWMFPLRVTRRRPGPIRILWRCVACDLHWTNEPPAADLKISCYKMTRRKVLTFRR